MDVSVVIVNYNTKLLTVACIASVVENTRDVDYEIILVDNDSSDGTVDEVRKKYPDVIISQMDENVGFGRANNAGAELAKGKYLFLLNSDTVLIENSIKEFFDFMENNPKYSACGCNLIDGEGRNVACHGCLPTLKMEFFYCGLYKIFKSYFDNSLSIAQKINEGNINNTGYISGADIFIQSDAFRKLNGFDPNIFMYFEETDLFYRMQQRDMMSCVLDDIKIIHYGGASSKQATGRKLRMFEKSRFYYYRKHYNSLYVWLSKVSRILNVFVHPHRLMLSEIGAVISA